MVDKQKKIDKEREKKRAERMNIIEKENEKQGIIHELHTKEYLKAIEEEEKERIRQMKEKEEEAKEEEEEDENDPKIDPNDLRVEVAEDDNGNQDELVIVP